MSNEPFLSFKVKGYKCFLNENDYQGFDDLRRINIIIGKNNSGKSKILEFVRLYVTKQSSARKAILSNSPFDGDVSLSKHLEIEEVGEVFRGDAVGGDIGELAGYNVTHYSYGSRFLNHVVEYRDHAVRILSPESNFANQRHRTIFKNIEKRMESAVVNSWFGYECISINAERDIKKEQVEFGGFDNSSIEPDGVGLTKLLARCLHHQSPKSRIRQDLIENTLLDKMNEVFSPDLKFVRIQAKTENNLWEIFLEEAQKGAISLSDCGSGIKTVMLVMMMLFVLPEFRPRKKFIYIFEELENNLHPSLERKLLVCLRDFIKNSSEHQLFLTTHSNVAIDLFGRDPEAQIYRARNDGKASFVEKVDDWNRINNLLDDLGVKASDVLQANCLIWLEGPSDRIYFNRWIQIFNDGDPLEEGLHYQCLFYGGSVLAQFSASPQDVGDDESLIKMLRVNRKGIILMDSDKETDSSSLKHRVSRIIAESKSAESAFTWITDGREVENYVPLVVLNEYYERYGKPWPTIDKYASVAKVDADLTQKSDASSFNKVKFASEIVKLSSYTRESLTACLDLASKMKEVISRIRQYNGD